MNQKHKTTANKAHNVNFPPNESSNEKLFAQKYAIKMKIIVLH